jgi:hypothetical protein
MESADFRQKIRAAWTFLNADVKLAKVVSSLFSLDVDEEFNEVALAEESTYQQIYLRAVSRSYYNVLLWDYSLFQFSWTTNESWRLAYLPNPWIAGVPGAAERVADWEALESLGAIDDEEVSGLISELPYYASIPPIRFEYAVRQYKELCHPAAHLHIGRHTENRWPVARLLNPLTFVMFIIKMYYSEAWGPLSSFYGREVENCLDQRFIAALADSGLARDFTEDERRSLHLTSQ